MLNIINLISAFCYIIPAITALSSSYANCFLSFLFFLVLILIILKYIKKIHKIFCWFPFCFVCCCSCLFSISVLFSFSHLILNLTNSGIAAILTPSKNLTISWLRWWVKTTEFPVSLNLNPIRIWEQVWICVGVYVLYVCVCVCVVCTYINKLTVYCLYVYVYVFLYKYMHSQISKKGNAERFRIRIRVTFSFEFLFSVLIVFVVCRFSAFSSFRYIQVFEVVVVRFEEEANRLGDSKSKWTLCGQEGSIGNEGTKVGGYTATWLNILKILYI